ncbi:hypothetical protein BofuT4_uP131460.1 [Botrytis cinerea T4]|uniref:Uncharacterized protein n=1 Tax=Botryotinia fuckeliana (strain T4) TaxID=999810 RepID=G2YQR8_BOTF4|nr:hypothetical protein BofuT4_uP131460.1 [Botrytis cinerea T4]
MLALRRRRGASSTLSSTSIRLLSGRQILYWDTRPRLAPQKLIPLSKKNK